MTYILRGKGVMIMRMLEDSKHSLEITYIAGRLNQSIESARRGVNKLIKEGKVTRSCGSNMQGRTFVLYQIAGRDTIAPPGKIFRPAPKDLPRATRGDYPVQVTTVAYQIGVARDALVRALFGDGPARRMA
jgi:hypothetical protein